MPAYGGKRKGHELSRSINVGGRVPERGEGATFPGQIALP